ncbi:MAG: HAD-IIIA family hydrolase [Cardiobacteriaceae bacterium]|nr:HAD-IIIA family hydrolase [Cardiobacteriaceae bacterium]
MFDFSKKIALFDRDGVLNEDRHCYVAHPDQLYLLSNALRGIARLTQAGFRIGICTNQGGIERGAYDEAMLTRIHDKLLQAVHEFGGEIERIVFCASADDAHPWRKPNPGMLLDQAAYFGVDLAGVPFVGDNLVDIQAARAAGAVPVLVRTGKGREVAHKHCAALEGVAIYANVETAVDHWLREMS